MAIQNPKTIRGRLKTAIQTITALQAVYGYYPKDLKGESPVCTIERLPIQVNLKTGVNLQSYDFVVTFWALTDGAAGTGLTAENAEDKLDDLHFELCKILKNPGSLALGVCEFIQPSELVQFTAESGNVYQSEMHYVRITSP
jgi:hypothetical protein